MKEEDKYKPTELGSGIFQWTAGTNYKTSLGGSFSTSFGSTTAVAAAFDNKMTLGTANSLKWAAETAVTFGKKFEYKDVDEIDFKKGSISIVEFSGARCLDLFQASAGLGTIQRGAFDAQRAKAKTAMKVLVGVDVFLALSTVAASGFGTAFGKGSSPLSRAAEISNRISGAHTFLSLAPILGAFCTNFLKSQQKTTTPAEWNPNAILQASATNGVFIGAAPSPPIPSLPTLASFIIQNAKGSNWTVFRGVEAPQLLGASDDLGALKKERYIIGYDMDKKSVTMSSVDMTEENVSIQTSVLALDGKSGSGSAVRTDSKLTGLFEAIDLTAQQSPTDKIPPNASLVLSASGAPSATLSAGDVSPANSCVQVTGDALSLKSGANTSLKLDAESATLRGAVNVGVVSDASAAIRATDITIQGRGSISIRGPIVRLG